MPSRWKNRRERQSACIRPITMGNLVLRRCLGKLRDDEEDLPVDALMRHWKFDQVILTVADVQRNVFRGDRPFSLLPHVAKRVHVYGHKNDLALTASRFINGLGSARLGQGWGKWRIAPHLDRVVACDVAPALQHDFQGIQDELVMHRYFYTSDRVVRDICNVLSGGDSQYSVP